MADSLAQFSPPGRAWFRDAFKEPTDVQAEGWVEISSGKHALLCAPTGSGKTLAAFFWCLDRLAGEPQPPSKERCRVLYISPLKALAFDVDRNLRAPLTGLSLEYARRSLDIPDIRVGVRTGDTPSAERRDMERSPPDILITTPESLFLVLTSAVRVILDSVRWVIVDEIHTMAASKRGAHLAVSLERLCERTKVEPQRIGLSATQRPLEEVARYLGGPTREVAIINAGRRKVLDLSIEIAGDDMIDLERNSDPRAGANGSVASGGDRPSTPDRSAHTRSLAPSHIIGITTEIAGARPWAREGGVATAAPARQMPSRSIWPAIYPRILELVHSHRSTIIFVNSRRMAERLAAKLNELSGEELVRAHHGSIAREQRMVIEDMLKAGKLPALVATSSLELGIDMGAVDLVIQVGSPATVAQGIQRIGRAGHSVGEPSVGTILPTHRGNLLESATIVKRMLSGEIETTRVPHNPIDVLAQQIVAMCALDEWPVAQLRAVISRAYPFSDLGDRSFEATLDMLDGRYPAEDFAELRPRIVWDRVSGTLRGRTGAQRLAVTSGGTIPDRGMFTVNMLDDGKRVGELDEEMVYELRVGETFILGATTWKTAEITQSQVKVVPAPGEPGKITFWHGDAVGRPVEVGRAIGELIRQIHNMDNTMAVAQLIGESYCNQSAAKNLVAYIREQAAHTGVPPDDKTIIIERFRDQLGDWRVCVLTPFGSRVHAPWALAVEARLRERTGLDIQSMSSDDGFALRLVDAESVPGADEFIIDPEDVQEAVTVQLHGSALFASRFRENAARALLLPRLRPGSRTPLWLQRQRSADLLRVAARHPSFPILAETYRECLVDVFDMEALVDIMRQIRARNIRVVEVETALPSPFSSSLVFDYIAQYMYEGDAPLAERRAQALTLDRELLGELLGAEDLRELLDPAAIAQTELELQGLPSERHPRDIDEAVDVFRHLGDLTLEEASARGVSHEWLLEAEAQRRLIKIRVAGEERWAAADDAGLYRDALGVSLPMGLPEQFMESPPNPIASLLRRWARTHVPFHAGDPAGRWRLPVEGVSETLDELTATGDLLAGQFRPGSSQREYCWPDVLRMLRRRSLAALRREVEAVPPEVLARFVPAWQGVGAPAGGLDRLADVIAQLQGASLPVSVLERDILAARISGYTPQMLDQLMAAGGVVWIGQGSLGRTDGRVALYLRRDVHKLLSPSDGPLSTGATSSESNDDDLHGVIRTRLAQSPCFFTDLLAAANWHDSETLLDALWDLVWSGEVTNDSYSPLRFIGPSRRSNRFNAARVGPPRSLGRWSLVSALATPEVTPTERAWAHIDMLLQRYGVVTREHAVSELIPGGFVGLYSILRAMEESGKIRRGYFVEGLGGAQFALPGAVDRLRSFRDDRDSVTLLAATDPACCYGVTMTWPELQGRPARAAGSYVVLDGGELRLYVERGGKSILTNGEIGARHLNELQSIANRIGKLELLSVNNEPVATSPLEPLLCESGFDVTHKGIVLYGATKSRR